MDPRLSRDHDEGRASFRNLARLRDAGGFSPLGTSIPPQSPVAWANFINGAGPGSHGIFDFIHRHPHQQCKPFYSAAEICPARRLGSGRTSAPARLLAVQPQAAATCCSARACRSGTSSTRPACRRPSTICRPTTRPARRSTATTAASAAWARRTCSGTYGTYQHFAEDVPAEGARRRRRQALPARRSSGETAEAPHRRPGQHACSRSPKPLSRRVPRPPRPARRTRR